jgi:hypothetical protein
VIVTAVVCPHPPALLRELCGQQDVVPALRAAVEAAVGEGLQGRPDLVAVVGGAAGTRAWDPALPIGVGRFGTTDAPGAECLPQSLGVARRLLDEAGWQGPTRMASVAWGAGVEAVGRVAQDVLAEDGRVALLVMADGSARRGEKAPGHVDERAFGFDEAVARALEAGDAGALSALDPGLADQLLAQGRAALAVLGGAVTAQGGRPRVDVRYRDDPHGVQYAVAVWEL